MAWAALGLALGLLGAGAAQAGPYFGEWGLWYNPHDCPRGSYSPLHYWAMEIYKIRAFCRPSYLDQYPPGPCPPVPPTFVFRKSHCMPVPPTPDPPYATPALYFGRTVTGQIDAGIDLPPEQGTTAPITPQGALPPGQMPTQLPAQGVTPIAAVQGVSPRPVPAPARAVISVTSEPRY